MHGATICAITYLKFIRSALAGYCMLNNPLLRKLRIFGDLNATEIDLLDHLSGDVRTIVARRDFINEGDRPEQLHLIVSGWAARYKSLPRGARQITAILLPGDFCDLHGKILGHMDHSILAITPCKIAWIASDQFDELTAEHAGLTRALWWGTLLDEAILRNWVVNVGRRNAYERVAHLICELHCRLKIIGLVDNCRMDFPLTQEIIGDATGLTPVHVNRTLQRLRADGLIELSGRQLEIRNDEELARVAGFDPSYLHLTRRAH